MTSSDLDTLQALSDAATPGPWSTRGIGCIVIDDAGVPLADTISVSVPLDQSKANAAFIAVARTAVPALIAEVKRLRETFAHSCTCSLADGAAPALRHEATCELRIAKTKRIDPALALSRFAKAMDSNHETVELQARLDAMTAARDEARCNAKILAHSYEHDSRPPARVVAQASAYPTKPAEAL